MAKQTIDQLQMQGKRVLMRVDFNVPLDDNRNVTNDQRIQKALPTIKAAVKAGARLILMSHLGRPKGERKDEFSLRPAAQRLSELLGTPVQLAPDCIGDEVRGMADKLQPGQVLMLENLRFYKGEEKNDPDFSRQLADLADLYVNDAFGTSHRKHASMYGVPALLPKGTRAIGYLVQKELKFLGEAMENPERPFAAILGGAKVSDKIGVIENLMNKVDVLLIGGAMSYTFMRAKNQSTGKSKVEATKENKDGSTTDVVALAASLLEKLKSARAELFLPIDHLCVQEFDPASPAEVFNKEIPEGWMGVDIGPMTIDHYRTKLADAKTVVWNGPMGVFEKEPWAAGTKAICQALADLPDDAITVIGGGDSAAAVEQFGYQNKVTHISTGGGASLEFLEGRPFDCLEVIDEA